MFSTSAGISIHVSDQFFFPKKLGGAGRTARFCCVPGLRRTALRALPSVRRHLPFAALLLAALLRLPPRLPAPAAHGCAAAAASADEDEASHDHKQRTIGEGHAESRDENTASRPEKPPGRRRGAR